MQQGSGKFIVLSMSIAATGIIILLAVLFLLSPYKLINGEEIKNAKINIINILLFYSGLFIFFAGLFSTLFFISRNKIKYPVDLYLSATTSLRQGVLIGVLVCILMFLQSFNFLIWWTALLVIIAMILVEMYLAVK